MELLGTNPSIRGTNCLFNRDRIDSDMVYNPLSPEMATNKMNGILKLIEAFLEKSTLDADDIEWNDALLLKIAIRIDQRSDYFMYFHSTVDENGKVNLDEMSQYKQIALLCFWIIKYKPLRIVSKQRDLIYYSKNHCTINETFAAYVFVSQIHASSIVKKQKKYYMSSAYLEDLFYKFMHHDISKEAMIFSLCSIVCCK